jgi:hypothetical protein
MSNNNSNISLSSTNISNNEATKMYFKRIANLTKEYLSRNHGKVQRWWNNFSFFQKLILIILFIGIPAIYFIYWVGNKSVQSINRNLGADYSLLEITNTLPFISVVSNNSEEQSLLKTYLKKYYSSMIKNGELNYKISHTELINKTDRKYTYSMWLYINGNESGVYNYFNHVLSNLLKTKKSFDDHKWSNYRYKKFKNIFLRGDDPNNDSDLNKIKQSPGVWLGPELTNLYIVFGNGENIESYLLENLELNKWINITVTIDNNTISIFKNGYLEITGMISSDLYINNIGNKNCYFMGNPSLGKTNEGYPGFINYFNFYNKVLTPEEIYRLYNNYLPLISSYMKKSISYNIEISPSVNIISENQSFDEVINIY